MLVGGAGHSAQSLQHDAGREMDLGTRTETRWVVGSQQTMKVFHFNCHEHVEGRERERRTTRSRSDMVKSESIKLTSLCDDDDDEDDVVL